MARKRPTGRWDKTKYPAPTKFHNGWVSKSQVRKFERTPQLRKYVNGMFANSSGGSTWANPVSRRAKLRGLPERKRKKK